MRLLFAPPESAKSTYVSVLLPSWYLANHPMHSILAATHKVEFAERWGRRVRHDIAAETKILGISLSEDSKAAARWSLTAGGEYYGVGKGQGLLRDATLSTLHLRENVPESRELAFACACRANPTLLSLWRREKGLRSKIEAPATGGPAGASGSVYGGTCDGRENPSLAILQRSLPKAG